MPPEIRFIHEYVNGMEKSTIDKLFFVDKISGPLDLLDFGCANGHLLSALKHMFSENSYFGYDKDLNMLPNVTNGDIIYSHNLHELMIEFNKSKKVKTLLLSSVIHEVYSYGSQKEIDRFWKFVFGADFKYIVIRDMIPSHSIMRPSHVSDVQKIYRTLLDGSLHTRINHLEEFQESFGSIEEFKNLVHFLLKYRYLGNWDREVQENYMPLHLETLYGIIPKQYAVIYKEHYCLPFLRDKIKCDFDIDLKDQTHCKLILQHS